MSNEKLIELAERAEAATGTDREIDAEIACIIGRPLGNIEHWLHGDDIAYRPTAYGRYVAVIPVEGDPEGRTSEAFTAKDFTATIDAAMSLVPAECLAMVKHLWDGPKRFGYAFVSQYTPDAEDCDGKRWVTDFSGCAETPALALTAAALRSRAAMAGRG